MRPGPLLLLIPLAGCASFPEFADDGPLGKPRTASAAPPAVSPGSTALAAKVDQIGSELVAQTAFLGVNPTFALVGVTEPAIGHPDLNGVLVSEGLAARCSDAELAAVLAHELAAMSVEAKRAKTYVDRPNTPLLPSTGAGDMGANRDPVQAGIEARLGADRPRAALEKPGQLAVEIYRAARGEAMPETAKALYDDASRRADLTSPSRERKSGPQWTN